MKTHTNSLQKLTWRGMNNNSTNYESSWTTTICRISSPHHIMQQQQTENRIYDESFYCQRRKWSDLFCEVWRFFHFIFLFPPSLRSFVPHSLMATHYSFGDDDDNNKYNVMMTGFQITHALASQPTSQPNGLTNQAAVTSSDNPVSQWVSCS